MSLDRAIEELQGMELFSPYAGQIVRTRGVMTARTRHGFFVQNLEPDPASIGRASSAIYVANQLPRGTPIPQPGALVDVQGTVLDFQRDENDKPCTQLLLQSVAFLREAPQYPSVFWLTADNLALDNAALARLLNAYEFMLAGVRAGAIFSQPSNPFGDYVVLPKGLNAPRSRLGSALMDPENPERWYPGFRMTRTDQAPLVDVGDRLQSDVHGPLNYRAGAFQIHALGVIEVERRGLATLNHVPDVQSGGLALLTLNAFNLDAHIERRHKVEDADTDIDDDVGDARFEALADVIVRRAAAPEIIALQEIQDNDGAEISDETDADKTYDYLLDCVRSFGGPAYEYAELAPAPDQDGGQPGGNIRNAFLYDPERIRLVPNSLQRLGEHAECFEGSRKALLARFVDLRHNREFAVINVHLASKRHQNSIFAPNQPGFDPREHVRIEQSELIRRELDRLQAAGIPFYVTGDFNDFEFSASVQALLGSDAINLVDTVPSADRFDYNHRGKLHTLMHAIVSRSWAANPHQVEILHGNELFGVQPGSRGTRATDHAYLWVSLSFASSL
jgi:uncharacterized protein